jgi:hypothetical protein
MPTHALNTPTALVAATPKYKTNRRAANAASGGGGMSRGKDESNEIDQTVTSSGGSGGTNSYYRGPAGSTLTPLDRVRLYTPIGPEYTYNPVNPNNAPASWFDLNDTERDGQGSLVPGGGGYPGAMATGVDRETFEAESGTTLGGTGDDVGDQMDEEAAAESRRVQRRRRFTPVQSTMYRSRGGSRIGMKGKLV